MSKIREAAMMRLKERAARLVRLLELEAPAAILVQGSWLIAEAAQLLSPDLWIAHVKEDMIKEQKRMLGMCNEPGCEEDVAWRPNDTTLPTGPYHIDSCEKHAQESEALMAGEDAEDEHEPWLGD